MIIPFVSHWILLVTHSDHWKENTGLPQIQRGAFKRINPQWKDKQVATCRFARRIDYIYTSSSQ